MPLIDDIRSYAAAIGAEAEEKRGADGLAPFESC